MKTDFKDTMKWITQTNNSLHTKPLLTGTFEKPDKLTDVSTEKKQRNYKGLQTPTKEFR